MIDKISLIAAYPEIFLLIASCAVLLLDLWVKTPLRSGTYYASLIVLALLAALYALYLGGRIEPNFLASLSASVPLDPNAAPLPEVIGFGGMIINDALSNALKLFSTLSVMAGLIYGRHYAAARGLLAQGGEFFALSLFALLGICIVASGAHVLVLYLGLELFTLTSYAMVALARDNGRSSEAAIKYFILGALASGFLLFGLSFLYGATGQLQLQAIFTAILQMGNGADNNPLLILALIFIVAGLAFKFSAAPFHMWAPDVYQGAPTAVTLLIAAAPKLAAFALVMRILFEGLGFLMPHWQLMMIVLAVLSLLVGNLAAIAQSNIRRLLAYSTIAQVGFILLGFATGFIGGTIRGATLSYSAALYYSLVYVITTLVVFGVLLQLARDGEDIEDINDLGGLVHTHPWYATILTFALLSLAGIPPLVGFFAKFGILQRLLSSPETLHLALGIFAILMSLIGCFYYLRIIKIIFFDPVKRSFHAAAAWDHAKIILIVNGLALLLLGLLPDTLIILCAKVIHYSLGI